MIDLILVIIFCFQIYRMAHQEGLSSKPYLFNYIAAFLLMVTALGFGMLHFFGPDMLQTEEGMKTAMMVEPLTISFEVALFVYFRKKIQKDSALLDEEDEPTHDTHSGEKKDFSYFR